MAETTTSASLRTLAAAIRAELPLLARTLVDLGLTAPGSAVESSARIKLYAAAALLDTFYTGIERLLERIARTFDAVPSGPHWHADLLATAALDVPDVRPHIMRSATASSLKRYLAFRHRFRNLYLFDLEAEQMAPLVHGAAEVWKAAHEDLSVFCDLLATLASEVERG